MDKGFFVRPAMVSDACGIAEVHVAAWHGAYEAIMPADVHPSQWGKGAGRRCWTTASSAF